VNHLTALRLRQAIVAQQSDKGRILSTTIGSSSESARPFGGGGQALPEQERGG
jgi:hypothetical protein